jgi:TonB family protein
MNRLQKKCFIGSAGTHLLLAIILIVGPGFLSSKNKTEDLPPIAVIPWKTVDAMVNPGGGNPVRAAATPPAPPSQPTPTPPAPTPPPAPAQPVRHTEARRETPVVEETHEALEPAPARRRLPDVPTTVVKRSDSTKKVKPTSTDDNRRPDVPDARQRAAEEARRAAARLGQAFAPSTTIESSGFGGGGEAYANYAQVVKSIYEEAWQPPADTASDDAIAKVKVTIANDGRVISAEIVRASGDSSVDRSVRLTLNRVTMIRPFPEGAKEKERTYTINFNLKAKRMLG